MRKPKAPEENRASIVAAAIDEFAARGFKGASMDAIAARTHTTRALINYYFGSKEKLYIAVLEQVYAEIREAEGALDLDHLAPVDAIRRIVEFTFDYYLAHKGSCARRGREPGEGPPSQEVESHAHAEPADHRPARARHRARARREGRFRPEVDPVEVHKAIAALGIFNVTNQYTFGSIFQRDMGAKGDVARRRDIVAEIILSDLTNFQRHAS